MPKRPGDVSRAAANNPGVTIISRESVTRPDSSAEEHPLMSLGDELDNMIIFDNVFVPREHIFHVGNPDHAHHYPQRLFDWLHWADLIRFGVKTELLAGLALLVGDGSGLLKIPATASRIADVIRFRETIRAFNVASDDAGFHHSRRHVQAEQHFPRFRPCLLSGEWAAVWPMNCWI